MSKHLDVIEYLQLIFIELAKLLVYSPREKELQLLWLYFLRKMHEKTTRIAKELLEVPEIAWAIELGEEVAYSERELKYYLLVLRFNYHKRKKSTA